MDLADIFTDFHEQTWLKMTMLLHVMMLPTIGQYLNVQLSDHNNIYNTAVYCVDTVYLVFTHVAS